MKKLITVFTPTYNRAYLLPKLYESLVLQNYKHFEWVVIDDGSTDDTEKTIREWIKNKKISITYHKQENGGKHRAINKGIEIANGELFFIVDSDDFLTENALSIIVENWSKIEKLPNFDIFLGIAGHRITESGEVIGNKLPEKTLDTDMSTLRYKHFISGDKAEVFKTNILRKHPFPDITGEKFCSEGVLWHYLSEFYIIRYIDVGFYVCKYLPDGLTDNSVSLRYSSPYYTAILYSTILNNKIVPVVGRIKAAINFWRFKPKYITSSQQIFIPKWAMLFRPFGKILNLKDKKRLNEKI